MMSKGATQMYLAHLDSEAATSSESMGLRSWTSAAAGRLANLGKGHGASPRRLLPWIETDPPIVIATSASVSIRSGGLATGTAFSPFNVLTSWSLTSTDQLLRQMSTFLMTAGNLSSCPDQHEPDSRPLTL